MPYKINPFTGNPDYYDASTGGTVTSVASGTGLTGGPITTTGTLSVDSATVPYYVGGPASAGFVKWNGTAWAIDITSYVNKAGDTMTGSLILNGNPTTALGAATKQYVDNIATGINFHAPVVAATTVPLPSVTYNNAPDPLNPGVGATLIATSPGALTIDTITFLGGGTERVLIKNQVSGVENGIYVVNNAGNAITPFQLTRAIDADNSPAGELAFGDFCFVEQGPTNGSFGYILNTPGTIIVGVTALSYVIFNAAQVVTAGTGLLEATPNVLSVDITKVPFYSGGFLTGFAKYDGSNWIFDNSTYLDTTTAASTYLTQANAALQYYPLSSNPAGYITSGSLSGYVPFTGATSNVNLGAFSLTTAGVNISGLTTGSVLFAGASGALSQDNANFFWDDTNNRLGIGNNIPSQTLEVTGTTKITGLTNIGNASATNQLVLRIGQQSAFIDIGSVSAAPSDAIISMNQNLNAGITNYTIRATSTITRYNSPQFTSLQVGNLDRFTVRGVVASGANPNFNFINPAVTGQTASTNVPNFRVDGATKQWATGNITNQYWNYFTANTADFVSASTITNSYGLYVEAAAAGTNATITNNYALGVKGQIGFDWTVAGNPTMRIGSWLSPPASSFPTYGWGIVTSNDLFRIPSTIYFGDTNFVIKKQGIVNAIIEPFDNLTLRSINTANGGQKTYLFGNQATGNVSIGSITATERLTISGGNILLEDAGNFIVGTTTGTKFGTSTSQKIGFFNATPIVQPTAVTTVQDLSTALSDLGLIAVSSPSIWNVTTQSGATYIASNNDYVLVNASTQTITLPAPAPGRRVGVKVITSVTNIQVITNGSGITIDGVDRSSVGLGIYNQWDAYTFVSSGSAWYIES